MCRPLSLRDRYLTLLAAFLGVQSVYPLPPRSPRRAARAELPADRPHSPSSSFVHQNHKRASSVRATAPNSRDLPSSASPLCTSCSIFVSHLRNKVRHCPSLQLLNSLSTSSGESDPAIFCAFRVGTYGSDSQRRHTEHHGRAADSRGSRQPPVHA